MSLSSLHVFHLLAIQFYVFSSKNVTAASLSLTSKKVLPQDKQKIKFEPIFFILRSQFFYFSFNGRASPTL